MDFIDHYLSLFNLILIICSSIGGFIVFRHAQKISVIAIQEETITALQQQIDAIKDKVSELERENISQSLIIETIQSALKKRGILITIDGDLVSIQDASGTQQHYMRKADRIASQPLLRPSRRRLARKKPSQGDQS